MNFTSKLLFFTSSLLFCNHLFLQLPSTSPSPLNSYLNNSSTLTFYPSTHQHLTVNTPAAGMARRRSPRAGHVETRRGRAYDHDERRGGDRREDERDYRQRRGDDSYRPRRNPSPRRRSRSPRRSGDDQRQYRQREYGYDRDHVKDGDRRAELARDRASRPQVFPTLSLSLQLQLNALDAKAGAKVGT